MSQKRKMRRASRVIAVKALFYFLSREQEVPWVQCFDEVWLEFGEGADRDMAMQIIQTAIDNLGKIKLLLKAFAPEYTYEKIAPINRALLLLGFAEMKFMDTPPVVVINEYIEIAKDYAEDRSPHFINGVLDNYRKSLGLQGSRNREQPPEPETTTD